MGRRARQLRFAAHHMDTAEPPVSTTTPTPTLTHTTYYCPACPLACLLLIDVDEHPRPAPPHCCPHSESITPAWSLLDY